MQVTISNNIKIQNPSAEIVEWCKSNLTIDNPEFAKKVRMGFWLGNTPKYLHLYEVHGDTIVLPYGTLKQIQPLIKESIITTEFKPFESIDYGKAISLYPYQEKAVRECFNAKYGILQSKAGSGKGLPLDATIYTPSGKKRMGDLVVGDEVLNTYGTISKVTNIFDRGNQPCFEIFFDDDNSVICDNEHLWSIVNENGKKMTVSSQWLFDNDVNTDTGRHKYRIPNTCSVYFDTQKVPINAWLFGFLLGDGYFGKSITFSTSEPDLLDRVKRFYADDEIKHYDKHAYDYTIVDRGATKDLIESLGLLGHRSWEKFIPDCYKYNDREIRLSVLQGLVDSDGSVKDTQITITSTSERLIQDILEIVESLGGVGNYSTRQTSFTHKGVKKEGRQSYRLYFKLPNNLLPCSSKKHLSAYSPRTKYRDMFRKITAIKPCGNVVTRCITVDSTDSLFLTDHFIPTHNTRMSLELIKKYGRKTLFLCHTRDLLSQSKRAAEEFFDKDLFGTITEGKVNIGKGITFATVQTMCKLDLSQYKDVWDLIIVDEAHNISGSPTSVSMYYKVLNSLSARHKYGLSATVHRADGLIKSTFALIGDVVYTVPDEAIADKVMQVGIKPVGTGVKISRECLNTDGTLNYIRLINYLCENPIRNNLIRDCIVAESDESCLILSDRICHLETLLNLLPPKLKDKAVMITGKMTTKKGKIEREQALEDMRTGKKKYLFATYKLCKEGLDIPRLERLFLTTNQKDYAVITQSIGRIARTFDGKADPICYDFVDDIGYLVKSYKKRCSIYKKNNCYFLQETE